jgi:hypothetical protein
MRGVMIMRWRKSGVDERGIVAAQRALAPCGISHAVVTMPASAQAKIGIIRHHVASIVPSPLACHRA